MIDFFEQQAVAQRRTGWLIVYFALAVVAIIVAIYLVVALAMVFVAGNAGPPDAPNPYIESPWHPGLFALVAVCTVAVILLGSVYKTAQLASGGEAVALMMGGRLIDRGSGDLAERRLLNVVEEMALAAGIPVPPVYVMDREPSINAFAAGHRPADAVIGVSQGCLTYLNRDELQGVMAHEFSHIVHGDMRLNLRLIGVLHGILMLAIVGWFVLRSVGYSGGRSRGNKEGGAVVAILAVGVGLLVIGSLGLFFGKLIKSGVSRQREFLADASAVQFTRLPDGIAGALKKIGGRPETSRIKDAHAEEISHMFFGNSLGSLGWHLFATHPPLAERIRRIDPSFDGQFPKRVEPVDAKSDSPRAKTPKTAAGQAAGGPLGALGAGGRIALDPTGVLGKVGMPGMGQLVFAAALLESMPDALRQAIGEPYGARAAVYALLLDRDAAVRGRQLDALRPVAEDLSFRETQRLAPLVDGLAESSRLPLVETAVPALKRLSPAQYEQFRRNIETLIRADNRLDLFEYAVRTVLLSCLDVQFGLAKPTAASHWRLDPLMPSVVGVLSTLAHAGQEAEADVRGAFDRGMREIGRKAALLPKADCSLTNFDAALKTLAEAGPKLKPRILSACVACVAADGKVTPREAQLVQAVAAVLGVPLPPLAASAA